MLTNPLNLNLKPNPTNKLMKSKLASSPLAMTAAVLLTLGFSPATMFAQGTAFTYQGRLNDGANPANGRYDVRFALYDALTVGAQQGNLFTNAATVVSNGLFTVTLDFGNQFPGASRWLEIGVRTNGGISFFTLSPRQPLTPAPYAITAGNVISGGLTAGTYGSAVTLNNAANSISGTFVGNGASVTNVNAATLNGLTSAGFWRTNGNAGADPATGAFIGTTDNLPLEFKVNGQRGLRLEPTIYSDTVNVIGGSAQNSVDTGVAGATISGGSFNKMHSVQFAAIGGGSQNTIQTNASYAVIGGGRINTIQSDASDATINGGYQNIMWPYAVRSTIGGGSLNTVELNTTVATIGGGNINRIQFEAQGSTISGGEVNTIQTNAAHAVIGGGFQNTIQTDAACATIGGGNANRIQVESNSGIPATYATIGGGNSNTTQTAVSATIGGGELNSIQHSAIAATIGGGSQNTIQPLANFAIISGGLQNQAFFNTILSTIGGGGLNTIQDFAIGATIGGGFANTVQPNANYATIPGGQSNSAAAYAFAAGNRAKAIHTGAFVWGDSTSADFPSTANDQFCIRAHGGVQLDPLTSQYFGAQSRQMLNLWGTSYGIGVQASSLYFRCNNSASTDGFIWYRGGAHNDAYANSGGGTELMHLIQGGLYVNGTFVSASDRNLKENFKPVSAREMLDKVATLPISRWNYKQDASSEHVGPMAQDFYAAFSVGPDDKHITTIDESGVALAAIQGLNQKLEETRAENADLKQELAELKQLVQTLVPKH